MKRLNAKFKEVAGAKRTLQTQFNKLGDDHDRCTAELSEARHDAASSKTAYENLRKTLYE